MIEVLYSTGLALCLVSIALGLRHGMLAPLTLFGGAILLGVYARYPSLASSEQYFGFASILARSGADIEEMILFDFVIVQLCVLTGYYVSRHLHAKKFAGALAGVFNIKSNSISNIACWSIFLGSWAFLFFLLAEQYGGLAQSFQTLQSRAQIVGSDVTIASAFVTAGLGALCMLAAKTHQSGQNKRSSFVLLAVVGIVHVYLIFLTGGRQETVIHGLAIAGTLLWNGQIRAKLNIANVVIAGIAGLGVVAILVIGLAMRQSAQSGVDVEAAIQTIVVDLPQQLSATFNTYDLYAGAKHFADHTGITYGSNYLDFFARIVPRSFWPDKPLTLNIQLREYFFHDRLSGVPPTLFGEMYIALGVFGLALGSALYGAALKVLAYIHFLGKDSPVITAIYLYSIVLLTVGMIKTGAEIGVFSLLYFLFGVIVVRTVSRFRLSSGPAS